MCHRSLLLVGLWAAACGADTPGKSVRVIWQLDQANSSGLATFDTDTGFHVELEEARVGLAAAYAYGPLPDSTKATAWHWLRPASIAHAHGGLDPETGRKVLAELLGPTTIDVLGAQPRALPPTTAEAGALDAVKIELTPPGSEATQELHGGSVYMRGRAERDGMSARFEASVALDRALKARSIDLSGVTGSLDEGSVLHLHINPAVWLRDAQLDRLSGAGSDDVVSISADSQVGRALAIGVRSPEAFEVTVTSTGVMSP
jgi:hypothetical protein